MTSKGTPFSLLEVVRSGLEIVVYFISLRVPYCPVHLHLRSLIPPCDAETSKLCKSSPWYFQLSTLWYETRSYQLSWFTVSTLEWRQLEHRFLYFGDMRKRVFCIKYDLWIFRSNRCDRRNKVKRFLKENNLSLARVGGTSIICGQGNELLDALLVECRCVVSRCLKISDILRWAVNPRVSRTVRWEGYPLFLS